MKGVKRPVTWVHSDKRGKQSYESVTALAHALGYDYRRVARYIKLGYTGDADIGGKQKQQRRASMAAKFKELGIKWKGSEQ